jgi:hypothetical protein
MIEKDAVRKGEVVVRITGISHEIERHLMWQGVVTPPFVGQ